MRANQRISHARHSRHHFNIVHADDIRPTGDTNGAYRGRALHPFHRRQVQRVTDERLTRSSQQQRIAQGFDLTPMMEKGVDTIVMGCTHYPFVIPLIQQIVGEEIRVIDPAPAIARQLRRMLEAHNLLVEGQEVSVPRFITSGKPTQFQDTLYLLLQQKYPVSGVFWRDGEVCECA
jgi:hypothetical protein